MSCQLGALVSELLSRFLGDLVARVGSDLFTYGSKPVGLIVKSTGMPRAQVVECLRALLKYNLATFEPAKNEVTADYKLCPENVLQFLRYPRYLLQIKNKFGSEAELIIEETLQNGSVTAAQLIINIARKCKDDPEKNITVPGLRDILVSLATAGYVRAAPAPERGDGARADVPSLVEAPAAADGTAAPPEVDVRALALLVGGTEQPAAAPDDVYWRVNFERFHQDFRDELMIKAITRRIDENAGELMRHLLILMYASAGAAAVPATDVRDSCRRAAADYPLLHQYLDQYLKVIEDNSAGMVRATGGAGGGHYSVELRAAAARLVWELLEHTVHERLGSNAARIFRLIRSKKYIEEGDIQKYAMLPAKEAKELTYRLMAEHFVSVQPMRKAATGGGGPSKAIYLYHIDFHQRPTPESVQDVSVDVCVDTAASLQSAWVARELAYQALYNCGARAAHERRQHRRLLEKQQRVSSIVHGMRRRGEPPESVQDVSVDVCVDTAASLQSAWVARELAYQALYNCGARAAHERRQHRRLLEKQQRVSSIVHGMRRRGEPPESVQDVSVDVCVDTAASLQSAWVARELAYQALYNCGARAAHERRQHRRLLEKQQRVSSIVHGMRRRGEPPESVQDVSVDVCVDTAASLQSAWVARELAYQALYNCGAQAAHERRQHRRLLEKQQRVSSIVHGMRRRGEPPESVQDVSVDVCVDTAASLQSAWVARELAYQALYNCGAQAAHERRQHRRLLEKQQRVSSIVHGMRRRGEPPESVQDVSVDVCVDTAASLQSAWVARELAYQALYNCGARAAHERRQHRRLLEKQQRVSSIVHGMRRRGEPPESVQDVSVDVCVDTAASLQSAWVARELAYQALYNCGARAAHERRQHRRLLEKQQRVSSIVHGMRRRGEPPESVQDVSVDVCVDTAASLQSAWVARELAYQALYNCGARAAHERRQHRRLLEKQQRVSSIVHGMRRRGEPPESVQDVSVDVCVDTAASLQSAWVARELAYQALYNCGARAAHERRQHRRLLEKQQRVSSIVHGMRRRGEPPESVQDVSVDVCVDTAASLQSAWVARELAYQALYNCGARAAHERRQHRRLLEKQQRVSSIVHGMRRRGEPPESVQDVSVDVCVDTAASLQSAWVARELAYQALYNCGARAAHERRQHRRLLEKQQRVSSIVHGMRRRGEPPESVQDVSVDVCVDTAASLQSAWVARELAYQALYNCGARAAHERRQHRRLLEKQQRVSSIVHGMRRRGEPPESVQDVSVDVCVDTAASLQSAWVARELAYQALYNCGAQAAHERRQHRRLLEKQQRVSSIVHGMRRRGEPPESVQDVSVDVCVDTAASLQSAWVARELAYQALYNCGARAAHERRQHRRLLEKQQRVSSIVHGMRRRGETPESVQDVSVDVCVDTAASLQSAWVARELAYQALYNCGARAAHERRQHRRLLEKQQRVSSIVHGMRRRGEPPESVQDVSVDVCVDTAASLQSAWVARELAYQALYNCGARAAHERRQHRRLLEKQQRVSSIVHGMRRRGEPPENVQDMEDTITPPEKMVLQNIHKMLKQLSTAEIQLDRTLFVLQWYFLYKS